MTCRTSRRVRCTTVGLPTTRSPRRRPTAPGAGTRPRADRRSCRCRACRRARRRSRSGPSRDDGWRRGERCRRSGGTGGTRESPAPDRCPRRRAARSARTAGSHPRARSIRLEPWSRARNSSPDSSLSLIGHNRRPMLVPRPRTHRIATPDGRVLVVDDHGDERGPAVIGHHGTPRCRLDVPADPAWIADAGIRLVIFDRAGYGGSTNLVGRTVVDSGDDVRAVADARSIETFGVIGVSWGGPHALATAARLGDRVTRLCVCSGLAPAAIAGFDAEAGLPDATLEELRAARTSPEALRGFVERHADPAATS